MNTDATLQELWQIKDARALSFAGDVRALCRRLMETQNTTHREMPLIRDFDASVAAQRQRIAKLPAPVAGEDLLPDDAVMGELRSIRENLPRGSGEPVAVLREEPPPYGGKKD